MKFLKYFDDRFWRQQTVLDWLSHLRVWDWVFLAVLYGIYSAAKSNIEPTGTMVIPGIPNDPTAFANNTLFAYPIRFSSASIFCLPQTLSNCISDPDYYAAGTNEAYCCENLFDKTQFPGEEVPESLLYVIAVVIPLLVVIFRVLVYYIAINNLLSGQVISLRTDGKDIEANSDITGTDGSAQALVGTGNAYSRKIRGFRVQSSDSKQFLGSRDANTAYSSCCDSLMCSGSGSGGSGSIAGISVYFWVYCLVDSITALASVLLMQAFLLDYLKNKVSAPRPIYYALQLFASVYPDTRTWAEQDSHHSWPSGHSSTTAAGMGYIACLLLHDAYNLQRHHRPLLSRGVFYCALVGLVSSFWVAATRIRDYYHFAHDVVTGMVIGYVAMAIGYVFYTRNVTKRLEEIYHHLYCNRYQIEEDDEECYDNSL